MNAKKNVNIRANFKTNYMRMLLKCTHFNLNEASVSDSNRFVLDSLPRLPLFFGHMIMGNRVPHVGDNRNS